MYWTSAEKLHATTLEASINLMKTNLRFNICDMETSYTANMDVNDLPQKIKNNIPESLLYSCLYWATHITEANRTTAAVLVSEFLLCLKAIYWVEVLSLVDDLRIGLDTLQNVMVFLQGTSRAIRVYTIKFFIILVGK